MIVFPNAKINLGLQITEKLPNGYHSINSCLYPIPWSDIMEVIPSNKIAFNATGIEIPGKDEDDIVLKAYKLLRKDFPLPEINIHLHKMIPIGAGLGGGSSDAAFMLKFLSNEFQLFLETSVLEDYAAQLGSDCSFFINNLPALATGTGTDLEPLDIDLSGLHLLVINPGIHVSTSQAYSGVVPKKPATDLRALLSSKDFSRWQKELINDFEPSLFEQHSELPSIKQQLYQNGAVYASMSGSGSTMFGLFEKKPKTFDTETKDWNVKEFIL
jgi:4-diphosphocytidyl-2-C-methyl-D-erythritol kinase